jgi:hypothetical protein
MLEHSFVVHAHAITSAQYLLVAAAPYDTIAFKIPNR